MLYLNNPDSAEEQALRISDLMMLKKVTIM